MTVCGRITTFGMKMVSNDKTDLSMMGRLKAGFLLQSRSSMSTLACCRTFWRTALAKALSDRDARDFTNAFKPPTSIVLLMNVSNLPAFSSRIMFCTFVLDGPPKDRCDICVSSELFLLVSYLLSRDVFDHLCGTLVTWSTRDDVPVALGPLSLGAAGSRIDFLIVVCSS